MINMGVGAGICVLLFLPIVIEVSRTMNRDGAGGRSALWSVYGMLCALAAAGFVGAAMGA